MRRKSIVLLIALVGILGAGGVQLVTQTARADCKGACQKILDSCLETCKARPGVAGCNDLCHSEFKRCADACAQ
jgi:hypothetical protein